MVTPALPVTYTLSHTSQSVPLPLAGQGKPPPPRRYIDGAVRVQVAFDIAIAPDHCIGVSRVIGDHVAHIVIGVTAVQLAVRIGVTGPRAPRDRVAETLARVDRFPVHGVVERRQLSRGYPGGGRG